MKRRVNIDHLAIRVRGRVGDPRALAEAISKTIAARLAAETIAGERSSVGGSKRHVASIDAGHFTEREAPEGAAQTVAAALARPQTTREGED